MISQLLRALSILLPNAAICVVSERTWHSLGFSGKQIELSAIMVGESHPKMAEEFDQMLPDHDFDLNGVLVADIAVIERVKGDRESRLVIHALLLGD